jgi:hypothetical protein
MKKLVDDFFVYLNRIGKIRPNTLPPPTAQLYVLQWVTQYPVLFQTPVATLRWRLYLYVVLISLFGSFSLRNAPAQGEDKPEGA